MQTSLPQLLTHDLDYFLISSQRHIPSPRLVYFVPPIHFFPYYTNGVWNDKHLHHFLKGSWILFWVAFGIVRSIHHRHLQLKWTDSQIRKERIVFFEGIYGCRDQAHSEVCFSDFKVLGSGHNPLHSAGPSVSLSCLLSQQTGEAGSC